MYLVFHRFVYPKVIFSFITISETSILLTVLFSYEKYSFSTSGYHTSWKNISAAIFGNLSLKGHFTLLSFFTIISLIFPSNLSCFGSLYEFVKCAGYILPSLLKIVCFNFFILLLLCNIQEVEYSLFCRHLHAKRWKLMFYLLILFSLAF